MLYKINFSWIILISNIIYFLELCILYNMKLQLNYNNNNNNNNNEKCILYYKVTKNKKYKFYLYLLCIWYCTTFIYTQLHFRDLWRGYIPTIQPLLLLQLCITELTTKREKSFYEIFASKNLMNQSNITKQPIKT